MKVLHVYRSLDRKIGGPATSVPALCRELSFLKDTNVFLLTFSAGDIAKIEDIGKTRLIVKGYKSWNFFSLFFIILPCLPKLLRNIDIIHLHGIWPLLNSVVAFYALLEKKKIVVSPRASFMQKDFAKTPAKKIKKTLAWNMYIKFWAQKAIVHVTSESENKEVKKYWYKAETIIIPNGVNVNEFRNKHSKGIIYDDFPELKGKKIILFLSRIVPNKGLTLLTKAWGQLAADFPDWHLLIAGEGDEKYWLENKAILEKYNLQNRYTYAGHLDGTLRLAAYNAAALFVLPTSWENFGIVIAEAFIAKIPVITTTKAPWHEIVKKNCGWIIKPEQEALTHVLKTALSIPDDKLSEMGTKGFEFVKERYDWESIAMEMRKQYSQMLLKDN